MTNARRKLMSLRSLTWADRAMVVEAALLLSAARVTLRLVPYRWFRPWLAAADRGIAASPGLADRVRRSVAVASRNLPFDVVCLPRAMAAKVMLAWRGYGSSLVMGAGHDDDSTMILHAWLESGGTVVVGDGGRSSVTRVVTFGGDT